MAHADRVRRLLELQGSHPVERALLDGDVVALAGVLEPDRAERLTWRARRMLELGVVLLRGVV
jgi:hypothetical protein